jgi:hypothetical protein
VAQTRFPLTAPATFLTASVTHTRQPSVQIGTSVIRPLGSELRLTLNNSKAGTLSVDTAPGPQQFDRCIWESLAVSGNFCRASKSVVAAPSISSWTLGVLANAMQDTMAGAPAASLRYLTAGYYAERAQSDPIDAIYVAGFPTAGSAVAALTGTARYDLYLDGTSWQGPIAFNGSTPDDRPIGAHYGPSSIQVNFAARTVSVTARIYRTVIGGNPTNVDMVTATGTATIEAGTGRFSGSFDPVGAYTGSFSGALFGPAGEEIGMVFALSAAETTPNVGGRAFGWIYGFRQ